MLPGSNGNTPAESPEVSEAVSEVRSEEDEQRLPLLAPHGGTVQSGSRGEAWEVLLQGYSETSGL